MDIKESLSPSEAAQCAFDIGWHDKERVDSLAIGEEEILSYIDGGPKPTGLETQARRVADAEQAGDRDPPSWVGSLQYQEDIGKDQGFEKDPGGSYKTLFLGEDQETLFCYARHHSTYEEREMAIEVYIHNIEACNDHDIQTAFDSYERADITVDGIQIPALELSYNEAIVPYPSNDEEWGDLFIATEQRQKLKEEREAIESRLDTMLAEGEIAYTSATEIHDDSSYGLDLDNMAVIVRDIGEFQICPKMPYRSTEALYDAFTDA